MNHNGKCGCGKPSEEGRWHCQACRVRIQEDFQALLDAARKSHRSGAGGAAMCICGAGGGGSAACGALGILRIALTTENKLLRQSILDAIGWSYF